MSIDRRDFIGLAAGALSTACGDEAEQPGRVQLNVSSLPMASMAPLHLTHEQGYFADLGLDVTIHQLKVSYQATPLLAGGRLDVACSGLNPALFNIVAKGARLRLVLCRGIFSPRCPLFGVIYGNRKIFPQGLPDLGLLKGRRVSIASKGANTEFYLDTLLATVDMSSEDVQLVFLPEPERVAALVSGGIDAMISDEYLEVGLDELFPDKVVRGMGLSEGLPNFQYAFVAFGPSMLERDPEIGVRFLTAYLHGARDFLQG